MPNLWVMWHRSSENDLINKIDQLNLTSEGGGRSPYFEVSENIRKGNFWRIFIAWYYIAKFRN